MWTIASALSMWNKIPLRDQPGARFSKLPGPLSCFVFHSGWEFQKVWKLYGKVTEETKWSLLEVRTHPTFLGTLTSKSDFGPVKLPGLSRNGLLVPKHRVPKQQAIESNGMWKLGNNHFELNLIFSSWVQSQTINLYSSYLNKLLGPFYLLVCAKKYM